MRKTICVQLFPLSAYSLDNKNHFAVNERKRQYKCKIGILSFKYNQIIEKRQTDNRELALTPYVQYKS